MIRQYLSTIAACGLVGAATHLTGTACAVTAALGTLWLVGLFVGAAHNQHLADQLAAKIILRSGR